MDPDVPRERIQGICCHWNSAKGFGFLRSAGNDDVFCHTKSLDFDPSDLPSMVGVRLEYSIGLNAKTGKQIAKRVSKSEEQHKGISTVSTRIQGKCMHWNKGKGFGFIERDDGSADVFVHKSALLDGEDHLEIGDLLEFEIGINSKNGKVYCLLSLCGLLLVFQFCVYYLWFKMERNKPSTWPRLTVAIRTLIWKGSMPRSQWRRRRCPPMNDIKAS